MKMDSSLTIDLANRLATQQSSRTVSKLLVYGCLAPILSLFCTLSHAEEATIDRLTIGDLGSRSDYNPSSGFAITPWRDEFFRSDGVVYPWGAGVTQIGRFHIASTDLVDGKIQYQFDATTAPYLTEYTDFSFGDYGSTGTLKAWGPMVVVADIGSSTATFDGYALIAANGYGYSPPRGALYSAPIGSIVPVRASYQLIGGTWAMDTFNSSFSYRTTGSFEFSALPEPSSSLLLVIGALHLRRHSKWSHTKGKSKSW